MENINQILSKYFAKEATPDEIQQVEEWKANNAQEFEVLKFIWTEEPIEETIQFDASKAWDKVQPKLEMPEAPGTTKVRKLYTQLLVAASMVLAVGGAYYFELFSSGVDAIEVSTAEISDHVLLPDGSEVWVNKNSHLAYQENFTENRSLSLDGEAFFEVQPDKEHPFVVSTNNGQIKVLGTAFNVNTNNDQTVVSVEHGTVELKNEAGAVILNKNEQASCSKNSISEVSEVNPNFLSWQTGVFIFEDQPLEEVVTLLNQVYDDKLKLRDQQVKSCPVSVTFNKNTLEEIVEILILACDIQYQEDNGVYYLSSKGG